MIFDENKEKFHLEMSAGEPQEKATSLSETPSSDPAIQEKEPLVTAPPTPTAAPMRPIEQAKPAPVPPAARAATHLWPTSAVSPIKPAEQAKPVPTDTSSTNSLMKVILPAEKSKPISDASAGDKPARGFTPIVVENPRCQASRNIHQMLAADICQFTEPAVRWVDLRYFLIILRWSHK